VDVDGVKDELKAELVGGAVDVTAADAAVGEPNVPIATAW
jgi:hypothetical protein